MQFINYLKMASESAHQHVEMEAVDRDDRIDSNVNKKKKKWTSPRTGPIHNRPDLNYMILGLFRHGSKWTYPYGYGLVRTDRSVSQA